MVDATSGKVVAQVAKSDLTKFNQLGLKKVEYFTYKAADGQAGLWESISFPSNFDASKKYPLLASVYGGPGSGVLQETFPATYNLTPEYGSLVVQVSSRSAPGRGKRMLDQVYQKLGIVEMDDMAAGIRSLWTRPYLDKARVGIYGTSSRRVQRGAVDPQAPGRLDRGVGVLSGHVVAPLRLDLHRAVHVDSAGERSRVTRAGNAMNFAKNLKGRLLIYYGTADNNVHSNNSMQLIGALQQAGKSFEVQVGPDAGHSGVNNPRMMGSHREPDPATGAADGAGWRSLAGAGCGSSRM